MIRAAAFALALLAPSVAIAQDLPALFAVTDVASNDVLNVRAGPSAQEDIIGTLAPDAVRVEVVATSPDGRWGQINTGEQAGWAAMRFLDRQPMQSFPPSAFACFGTEPFWSMQVIGDDVTWSALGEDPVALTRDFVAQPMRQDRFALRAFGDLSIATLMVRKSACSDGMSDRAYGLEVDVILDGGDHLATHVYSGCCTLAD